METGHSAGHILKGDKMYQIVRPKSEIDDLLNDCADAESAGLTQYRAMSFEQGVKYAIEWLTNASAPHPLED